MFPQVETNLSLFEKTPCIRPVWDPGSPSGLVLTCLGSTDGRRREDGESKETISWTKVKSWHQIQRFVCWLKTV